MSNTSPEPTDEQEVAPTPRRRGRAAGTSAGVTGPGRRSRSGTAYSDLIRNLFISRAGETLSISEVSDAIGQNRSAVGMGLSALARRGILERVGSGQYRLAGTPGGPAPRAEKAAPPARRGRKPATGPEGGPAKAAKAASTSSAAARRGSGAVRPAAAARSAQLEVVFSLPGGEIILSDGEGGLWQAHRVALVAE